MIPLRALLEANSVRTLLAIIAIGVSIVLFRLNRKKKGLSYEIVRNNRLFKVDSSLQSRIQVIVDGKPAINVTLVIIDIQNTGNEAIRREDFDVPCRFSFGSGAEVISTRILEAKPRDLAANIAVGDRSITLEPLLLNSGDRLSIEVLLTDSTSAVVQSGRVVGIAEIKNIIRKAHRSDYTWWAVFLSIASGIAGYFAQRSLSSPNSFLNLAVSGLAASSLVIYWLSKK